MESGHHACFLRLSQILPTYTITAKHNVIIGTPGFAQETYGVTLDHLLDEFERECWQW